ncbi:MAG: hypothetical protein AABN95_21310 [Acidobacteriota bacterium]
MPTIQLPDEIEIYRDRSWCREPELQVLEVGAAERLIERLGFCAALTDSSRPGPSLYIAVCGRRDAHMPRNVQKDPESSLAWNIKDEMIRRSRAYYGKLTGGRSVFIARRLVSNFNTLRGITHRQERLVMSEAAKKILKCLRKEWELSTPDLRKASGIADRSTFSSAIDELQRNFKVLPSDVVYDRKLTYIWSLTESRFRDELTVGMSREEALKEIARAYLLGAGMTWRGELARVTGLTNPEAGIGNWALVDEDFATRVVPGVYRLKELKESL